MPLVTEMGRMQYSNIICYVHKNASIDPEKCLINSNFSSGEAERAGRRDGEREGRRDGSRKEGGRRYQGKEAYMSIQREIFEGQTTARRAKRGGL